MIRFIADLHLTPDHPGVVQGFLDYLRGRAMQAEALYILGDFFEYWVGDDGMDAFQQNIVSELRAYTDSGRKLYFMVGNRDFAIGRKFFKLTGATLLKDPEVITLDGQRLLLMHGDLLCTADVGYMKFRRKYRNPFFLGLLRLTPLSYRQDLANRIRIASQQAKEGKTLTIMDVTPEEVVRTMEKYHVTTLIHGHTHQPKVHDVALPYGIGKRYVLGDWSEKSGWEIIHNNGKLLLCEFEYARL